MFDKQATKLGQMLRTHASSLSRAHRMVYLMKMLWGSDYGWGDEIVGSADCSGSVFWALWLMGYPVRITAHGLYHRYTEKVHGEPKVGDLAFWWTDDKVTHVAAFSDNRVLVNAAAPAMHDVPVDEEIAERKEKGQRYEARRVNWEKLDEHKERGELKAYGVGDQLKPLLGMFEKGGA